MSGVVGPKKPAPPATHAAHATEFPDRAPDGYVWVIAELVKDRFCPSGYLRTRPELGRFGLHSQARASIHARRDAHSMTLVPVLIENMPVICDDDSKATGSAA